nr:PREDICTED: mucin-2-like [Bemisia tabaci]
MAIIFSATFSATAAAPEPPAPHPLPPPPLAVTEPWSTTAETSNDTEPWSTTAEISNDTEPWSTTHGTAASNTSFAPEPELPFLNTSLPSLNTTETPDDTIPLNTTSAPEPEIPHPVLRPPPEITTPTPETSNATPAFEPEIQYLVAPLPPLITEETPDDTRPLILTPLDDPVLTPAHENTTPTPDDAHDAFRPLDFDDVESPAAEDGHRRNDVMNGAEDEESLPRVPVYPPDFWDTIVLPGVEEWSFRNYTNYDHELL